VAKQRVERIVAATLRLSEIRDKIPMPADVDDGGRVSGASPEKPSNGCSAGTSCTWVTPNWQIFCTFYLVPYAHSLSHPYHCCHRRTVRRHGGQPPGQCSLAQGARKAVCLPIRSRTLPGTAVHLSHSPLCKLHSHAPPWQLKCKERRATRRSHCVESS